MEGGLDSPASCFLRIISAAASLVRCISVPLMLLPFFYICRRGHRSALAGVSWASRETGCEGGRLVVVVGGYGRCGAYLGGLLLEVGLAGLFALVAAGHGVCVSW